MIRNAGARVVIAGMLLAQGRSAQTAKPCSANDIELAYVVGRSIEAWCMEDIRVDRLTNPADSRACQAGKLSAVQAISWWSKHNSEWVPRR